MLPKFAAKIIIDTKNRFKVHKLTLSQKGIRPPRPKKKADSPSKTTVDKTDLEGTMHFNETPEIPSRYEARFGSTLDMRKIKYNAEAFKHEG